MTRETFTELILQSEDTLAGVAMSMLRNEADAQDAVQTAVLTAFEKLSTLKNEACFKTWLVRILINVCNKQLKSRGKITTLPEPTAASPQTTVELRAAIEGLPPKLRQVFVLHYLEGFTTEETARILKIPKGTVLSRLAKSRELLRIELH